MNRFKVETNQIPDWNSFHNLFCEQFSFPDYYGENMNAWIDCMEDLVIDGLTLIEFCDSRNLQERNPEIHRAILQSWAFINYRSTELGKDPLLIISMG